MPIQNSPPARPTRSQARAQAVLTPMPRAPLHGTPAFSQLRYQLEKGPNLERAAPSRKEGGGPRRSNSFSGVSDGTEGVPAPMGASQSTGEPALAQSNQPVFHQSEPSLLAIIQEMTQIMANLQEFLSSEASRTPAFRTPSMKAPELFDRSQPFKVRSFIQSCQLIFIMIRQISLETEIKFFMPLHFSLEGLQNGLSLISPISLIKIQITFPILGLYFNLNSFLFLGTQMKLEKLKQSLIS
ncbi:hypothetical protein O181_105463 [Austropuccinia psidii MF-1]|uniref:Uncharacterized protein n=1 Tax=Austropuccinia psidii MF-1 TaxID=1389203 RepID=A0A9Q3JM49_9BASI|nr:hypothetical protein [Austropuccinia psidii MF-1]